MSRSPSQEDAAGKPKARAPDARLPEPQKPKGKMTAGRQKLLGQVLMEMGKITQEQLDEAVAIKQQKGGAIGVVLVDLGHCEKADVAAALAIQAGMRRVFLDEMEVPPEVIEKMDSTTARSYSVIPIEYDAGKLTVAMADPNNFRALDELHMLLGCEVQAAVADPAAVVRALDKYYATPRASRRSSANWIPRPSGSPSTRSPSIWKTSGR